MKSMLEPENYEECEAINCEECVFKCRCHALSRFLICNKCGSQMSAGDWYKQKRIEKLPITMRKIECTNGECCNYYFEYTDKK